MNTVTNFEKFKLLLWKNWTLQWNHKWQFIFELLLPVIFSLLLVLIRSLVPVTFNEVKEYRPQNVENFDLLRIYIQPRPLPKFEIYFSPNNIYLEKIIQESVGILKLNGYSIYNTSAELQTALVHSMESNSSVLAGIEFPDSMAAITDYPRDFKFSVRFPSSLRTGYNGLQMTWYTMMLFPPIDLTGPRNPDTNDGGVPVGYLREGFLQLQHAVSMAYIKLAGRSPTTILPEIQMQRYPYPAYKYDPLLEGLSAMMSLIILLSFIYPCTSLTKYITMEKEKQLKEVMKIMGLQNWIHWAAWFVKAFIMLGISAIFITILLKIVWKDEVSVLTHANWSLLLVFLLIYVINAICYCFMMAVFFSRANTAAAVTGLVWFVTYIPYSFSINTYETTTLATKLGYSLFVNSALGFGVKLILGFEGTGEGIQWDNLFKTYSVDENCSLAAIMGMMLLSCVLYMMISLYIEQILPGNFGVPKKWYFPFTRRFWCGEKLSSINCEDTWESAIIERPNPEAFELEPRLKNTGVKIRNLKKKFGDRMAVKGLSMNMYEDEITVLLGHNGAGKTTTISMLTGMFPPTSGTAVINGFDIRTRTEAARASMGICPQHNVLFDDMSVANHIVFYSRLKGLKGDAIKKEVDKYLKMIELENKANAPASTLSGGMKRKLSVCCALCGGTKVVLCDEPSSGMDPAARRQLWELLQAEKVGRTLLLTTHFMDEADVLGDRIAIMCGGDLKCHGTSFFLKKKYGSGYRLICVKRENCNVAAVTSILQRFIPNIMPESNVGAELTYQLPDDFSPIFQDMFSALEEHSDELNLNGYGINITSMEEVFLKVGAEDAGKIVNGHHRMENSDTLNNIMDVESMQSTNDVTFSESAQLLKGSSLIVNQWNAMFLKKMLFTYRNKLLFFIQNLMPIFFIVMTILIVRSQGTFQTLKPMTISIKQYPNTVVVLESTAAVSEDSLEMKVAEQYKAIATSQGDTHLFESTGLESFRNYILTKGESLQVWVNTRYLASATVDNGKITAWLNNQPYHTAPLTMNLVHNALAKAFIGPQAEITVTNAPLPYLTSDIISQLRNGNNLGSQLASNLCFCMCFVSSFYALFVIKERESRAKLLQFVGGVNVWTFWITQYLWDFLTVLLTSLIIILTIACFQEDGFSTFPELGRYFLLLLVFGFGMLPFVYIISSFFSEPATGFARLSIINIFSGMALFITISVMSLDVLDTKDTADKLQWFCRLFPHFSLAWGINHLNTNSATRKACDLLPESVRCRLQPSCCEIPSYFSWKSPGILPEIVYLLLIGCVLLLIIICREYQFFNDVIYKIKTKIFKPPKPIADADFDDDVAAEKQRVAHMTSAEKQMQNLLLDRVIKYYGNFMAVNQISLGVKHNECFGLLGVNGAGKTTTFKMMTGDERITYGAAYIKGINLKEDMNQVYRDIGYCPQFDALLDDLTGRETLRIFCLLRGIQKHRITSLSEDLAKCFGFIKHLDKPTCAYSGGNKRKLSTAISVIGSPSVIFLDEPTTGMDPASRRQLWNMVCRIRDSGKSIVLTSHSMEECEALCTRLAIMVNGEFKCIGSTQHLKNKFSKGLVLKIKIKKNENEGSRNSLSSTERETLERPLSGLTSNDESVNIVKKFVAEEFPESLLQEEYQGILTFYIPLTGIKWSRTFGSIERNRNQLNIEDYSISQTTLEEIFLEFAKYQREDKRLINADDQ